VKRFSHIFHAQDLTKHYYRRSAKMFTTTTTTTGGGHPAPAAPLGATTHAAEDGANTSALLSFSHPAVV